MDTDSLTSMPVILSTFPSSPTFSSFSPAAAHRPRPRCRQDLDLLTKWRADPFCGKINSTKLNLSCTEQIMLAENLYHFSKQKLCKKFVRLSSICL